MHYTEIPADPPLDRIVRCFWFLRSDEAGGIQPVVPDGRVELILHLAQPFSLVGAGGAERQSDALLAGQLRAPIHLLQTGPADIAAIRFRTAAAGPALGMPLASLTGRVVPLADAYPVLAAKLLWAASRDQDPARRAARMSAVLLANLREGDDRLAREAVRRMRGAREVAPVLSLAREAGVSTRTLERRIKHATGLSPKLLHRVMRFRQVFTALDRTPPGHWARLAYAAGYYDQAHLIRDFRQFAGAAPSVFLSSEASLTRVLSGLSNRR